MSYADVRHWYEDPDEPDLPNGHCYGTGSRKCGRFVTAGAYHCQRCLDEIEAEAQAELDRDKAIDEAIAAEAAYWEAYWKSPEGLAEQAEQERQRREYEADIIQRERDIRLLVEARALVQYLSGWCSSSTPLYQAALRRAPRHPRGMGWAAGMVEAWERDEPPTAAELGPADR